MEIENHLEIALLHLVETEEMFSKEIMIDQLQEDKIFAEGLECKYLWECKKNNRVWMMSRSTKGWWGVNWASTE